MHVKVHSVNVVDIVQVNLIAQVHHQSLIQSHQQLQLLMNAAVSVFLRCQRCGELPWRTRCVCAGVVHSAVKWCRDRYGMVWYSRVNVPLDTCHVIGMVRYSRV